MQTCRTNIELDGAKLARAKKITGLKTAKAVVDFALTRLAATTRGLSSLVTLSGSIHFKKGYSYKKNRA